MKISWRWLAGAAVAVASIISVGASGDKKAVEDLVAVRPRMARATEPVAAEPRAAPSRVELERLQRPSEPGTAEIRADGVFGVVSWFVAPPPPPPPGPPPPPPPPSAPPVPFSYLGQYADAGGQVIILTKGDRVYTVAPGDIVEGLYSIDRIAGGRIELTYLPLKIKQTIPAG